MSDTKIISLNDLIRGEDPKFQYGGIVVERLNLDKGSNKSIRILKSYQRSGILPNDIRLIGDYLLHKLLKSNGLTSPAGKYLGIILPTGDYHYVRFDGESIGVKKLSLGNIDKITLLIDTCLFSASTARASFEDGSNISLVSPRSNIEHPISSIDVREDISIYELDTIVRLTDFVRSIKENNSKFTNLFTANPRVEYYFYLMEAYNNGLINNKLMEDWIEKVNSQSDNLTHKMNELVGLPSASIEPLDMVKEYVTNQIADGKYVNFNKVKDILSSDPIWNMVMGVHKPSDWKDLNNCNYLVALLDASKHLDQNEITLTIENPSEQKILRIASKLFNGKSNLSSNHKFKAISIYPHEKTLISGSDDARMFERIYYKNILEDDGGAKDMILRLNRTKLICPEFHDKKEYISIYN